MSTTTTTTEQIRVLIQCHDGTTVHGYEKWVDREAWLSGQIKLEFSMPQGLHLLRVSWVKS